VEIYNPNSVAIDLTNLSLAVVSGAIAPPMNADTKLIPLTGAGLPATIPANGYLVVGSSLVTVPSGVTKIKFPADTNQLLNNKAAVAIVDTVACKIIDTMSYGGAVASAKITPCAATFNWTEGAATLAHDDSSPTKSLIRNPNGADTNDNLTDW